jgi:hypothetical protein
LEGTNPKSMSRYAQEVGRKRVRRARTVDGSP